MQLNTDISNTLDILKWFVSQESRLVRENKVWLYVHIIKSQIQISSAHRYLRGLSEDVTQVTYSFF